MDLDNGSSSYFKSFLLSLLNSALPKLPRDHKGVIFWTTLILTPDEKLRVLKIRLRSYIKHLINLLGG